MTGVVCSIATVSAIMFNNNKDIRTSQAGIDIIGNAESCRTRPYYCPAGHLTIGVGSTESNSGKIENRTYSLEEIANRWAVDIKTAERCVNRYGNGKNMPQGAFDAMVSITFNVGCQKIRQSTLFKMARNGYTQQMCDQFPRWVYANGNKLKGLEIRRNKERQLCLQN